MGKFRTLYDRFAALAEHGERTAMVQLQREDRAVWNYAEFTDRAAELAQRLPATWGVQPGDRVVLLAASRPEWIVAFWAILRAGAIPVPLDVQYADDGLNHVLADSEPKLIFADARSARRLKRLERELPRVLSFDADADDEQYWLFDGEETSDEVNAPAEDDVAVLFYTSGTTGPPKGVPLSHRNLTYQMQMLLDTDVIDHTDRVLLPLPLHHVYPLVVGTLYPLASGSPIVFPRSLTGPQIVRAIHDEQVTAVIGVPRLYASLLDGIESSARSQGRFASAAFRTLLTGSQALRKLRLPAGRMLLRRVHRQFGRQLRVLASGGSPLAEDLAHKLEAFGWQVAIGYGLTETSPLVTLNLPGQGPLGSVGKAAPDTEIRIDPSARPGEEETRANEDAAAEEIAQPAQGRSQEGEILVRGPGIFAGYRHLDDKTEESFTNDWFRTGDLGYFDDHGRLYVTGRVSTMLITESGEKVQPDELEEAYAQPAVIREVGVLQRDGRVCAVVIPDVGQRQNSDQRDTEEQVRSALDDVAGKLPSYQHLSEVVLSRQALPRTRLGKIQRHKLRELFDQLQQGDEQQQEPQAPLDITNMSADDQALLDEPPARETWELLAEKYHDAPLSPDTNFQLDLNIDSMQWLSLSMEIRRRAQVELDEESIGRIETVRDLLGEVAERAGAGDEQMPDPLDDPQAWVSEGQRRKLRPPGHVHEITAHAMFRTNRLLMRTAYGLQTRGAEKLPEPPFVIVANHASYFDAPAISAALDWDILKHTYWAGWTGATRANPAFASISHLAKVVPVDPKRGVASSLALSALLLKRGDCLVWFPEGERSPDGKLQSFQPGIGMLLERFPVPVVPTLLQGTEAALPRGAARPRRSRVVVTFGDALDSRQLAKEGEGEEPQQRIARALHHRLQAMRSGAAQPERAETAA